MFGRNLEDEYANNISVAAKTSGSISAWPVIAVINLGLAAFIAWAFFFEIEEVTTGNGRVVSSSQLQVVQSLEGGIVRTIEVEEGQLVKKGEVLLQIDDTGFASKLGELQQTALALEAERVRLNSEAAEERVIEFPQVLLERAPVVVGAQNQIFATRLRQLDAELKVMEDRLVQRQTELEELAATKAKLQGTLQPLEKEAALTERMFKRGIVPEIENLRLQARLAEVRGDLELAQSSGPKLEAAVREAQNQIETTRNNYVLSARERLAQVESELAIVRETMLAAKDRVTRAQLRAPVDGVVNKLHVSTLGAVVTPGEEVVEIVPTDDGLRVDVRIRPQDVAFIRPLSEASVKLTAYDYLIYGSLTGKVVRIGADTLTDTDGEAYYSVVVQTDQNYLGDEKLPVIPGMIATVSISTGKNTVLSYLAKPLLRARVEALQ